MAPLCLLLGVLAWVCGAVGADPPIVLPPLNTEGPEAALLIIPGAYINGHLYQPLGEHGALIYDWIIIILFYVA